MAYYQQVEKRGTWLNATELSIMSGIVTEKGMPMMQRVGKILRAAGAERVFYHRGHRFFPVYEKESALKILNDWKAKAL